MPNFLAEITPVLLTRDEEVNIGRTLGQLRWAREVIVVDSESTDRTRQIAASFPNVRVTVEGHASRESAAQEAYNQRLSERRASTVAGALEQNGVNGRNVSSQGLGTRAPVASNDTESGRQQNRRVEVIIEN